MYIKVSWKEFHCPTAEKMATVARIGVQMGKTILKKTVRVPAPSTSAASGKEEGMDSMQVFTRMMLKGARWSAERTPRSCWSDPGSSSR